MKSLAKCAAAALLALSAAHAAYAAGSITVYTALEDDEISAYMKDAKQALPDVKINVLRLSTGDLGARILAEASNPQADVIWGFAVTNMLDPRIEGQLQPYQAKGESELPSQYRDPNGKWFAATGYMAAFCVNTERLKAKNLPMPASWQDLTKPEYKGEVVMPSPASSGTGYLQIAAILQALGKDKGFALLEALNKNIAQYTDSGSKPCKQARGGEYTIGVSFAFPAMQSIEQGYPVKMVIPSDWVGYELEASGLMKTAKNPADAKRFLDWTLSPGIAKIYGQYKEIVTIPGAEPSKAMVTAGLPKDLTKVLFPVNFVESAKTRTETVKTWQSLMKH